MCVRRHQNAENNALCQVPESGCCSLSRDVRHLSPAVHVQRSENLFDKAIQQAMSKPAREGLCVCGISCLEGTDFPRVTSQLLKAMLLCGAEDLLRRPCWLSRCVERLRKIPRDLRPCPHRCSWTMWLENKPRKCGQQPRWMSFGRRLMPIFYPGHRSNTWKLRGITLGLRDASDRCLVTLLVSRVNKQLFSALSPVPQRARVPPVPFCAGERKGRVGGGRRCVETSGLQFC